MNKIEKNGKEAIVRTAKADGSVMVFFEDTRSHKTYKTQSGADKAIAAYFAA